MYLGLGIPLLNFPYVTFRRLKKRHREELRDEPGNIVVGRIRGG